MAASAKRDLFININGSISGLRDALKAGKSTLLDFDSVTGSIVDELNAKLRNMGSQTGDTLMQRANEFNRSIKSMQASISQALSSSDPNASVMELFNTNAIQAQIGKAQQLAAAQREVAEAAQHVATAGGANAEAAKVMAVAYATAAVQTEQETDRLRQQLSVITEVDGALVKSSDRRVAAGQKVTVSAGQQRAAMQQLSYQVGDIAQGFAAGTPPMVIFSQQSGQVIQALQLMTVGGEGALGTIAKFAPYVGAALVVLAPFVAKLFEGGDASDKLKDKTLSLEEALSKQKFGTEAATKAIDDYNRAQEEQRQKDTVSLDLAIRLGLARLTEAKAIREKLKAQLESAASANNENPNDPLNTQNAGAISRYQSKMDANTAAIAGLETAINNFKIEQSTRDAKALTDPSADIKLRYDQAEDLGRRRAASGLPQDQFFRDNLTKILAKLEQQRQIEQKAADDAKAASRGSSANDQIGRTINVAEATRIVAGIGGRVTSGTRSYEKQSQLYADKLAGRHDGPVAVPGTSAHERGQAIDVAFGPGISPATIKRAFAEEGVKLTKLLTETGQRVSWKRSTGRRPPSKGPPHFAGTW